MKKIVLDTSVIIKWLNQNHENNISNVDKLMREAREGKALLFAPDLAKYEIGKVLLINKKLTQTESKVPLMLLFELPVEFVSLSPELAKESYAIASAYGLDFYDSVFLALAEQKKAIFITENLNKDALETGAKILALKDY